MSIVLIVGLLFGNAEGCMSAGELEASVVPVEAIEPEETGIEPAKVPADPPQVERAPPWSPPTEPLLEGVAGAGQLLARGEAQAALDRLAAIDKLDILPGEAALEPESREWFLAGATAGRAYMRTQQWEKAVLALEPLAASKKFGEMLPRDLVGYELGLARIAWALEGDLDPTTADIQLSLAASELGKLERLKPDRIHSAIRVAHGEALAGIRGADERARKAAAKKADAALDRLITAFPNHPRVGEWMLQRAQAKQRAGLRKDALIALRQVAIDRAGEPEAVQAWTEHQQLAVELGVTVRPLDTAETLAAGQAARTLRRVEHSTELLERVWNDPEQPRHRHREAGHSLGWTYYKARAYDRCADVLTQLYTDVPSMDTRSALVGCLERAGRYDEAIALWVSVYEGNKGAYGATALWNAIELAVNGGRYQRATELITEFETRYESRGSERRWLHAWLPMRLDQHEVARVAFEQLVDSKRAGSRERAATYFLGKLELRSDNREIHLRGVHRLQQLSGDAHSQLASNSVFGGHAIYYGLQARARLLEAGEDPGECPTIGAIDWEERVVGHAETLALLAELATAHGEAFSSFVRAEQLFAAGWWEEASREVRVAGDELVAAREVYGGSGMPGTRSEALVAGLSWAAEWRHPSALPSRAARKALRDDALREKLRDDFMRLSWAMHEPYHFAKLTSAELPYRTRWHLRAFREPIERHAWTHEVDPHHMWSLMYTESRFRRHVVSHVGARGALQIMPWTGRQLAEDLGEIERGDRFDPDILFTIEDNSRLAVAYIAALLKKFHGQPVFAYASYNGGPNNVARWLAAKSRDGVELDEFIEEIPFEETANYARRVLEVHATYGLIYEGKVPTWTNVVDPVFEDNVDY
jgi:soluble lytic murein transglycosylase-like protein/tetratricopeptide (TPR) repeat protein